MKILSKKGNVFNLSLLGFILASCFNLYSTFNLMKNNSLTLYTLVFGYSLFCIVGILYFLFESKLYELRLHPNNVSTIRLFTIKSTTLNKTLIISCYSIFTLTSLTLNTLMYTKSFLYYFLISIAAVIIGYQIVYNEYMCRKNTYIILFLELIPLAFLIRYSSFLINPYLIGPDTLWHFHSVQKIIENGVLLPSTQHYYYYPSYHLTQSISGLILGFSETSFNLINLSQSLVSILVAYLLSTEIFNNRKVGLITSLLFSLSTMFIFLVTYNTSKIGGFTLFLMGFFLLLKMFNKSFNSIKTHLVFWIISVTLFLWHPEVSFALMIMLGGVFLSNIFVKRRFELNTAFILYLISYIAFLVYIHSSLFISLVKSLFIEIPTSPDLVQNIATQKVPISLIFELFTSYLALTLPIFFVAYFVLKRLNNISVINFFLISLLILLHILPAFGIISGNFGFSPARIFVYVSSVTTIVFSGTFVEIFKPLSKKSTYFFVLFLFIFSFFSVSSYLVGDCNNIYNDQIPIQTTFTTKSVLSSHDFLSKTPDKSTIVGDYETLRYICDPIRGVFDLPGRKITCFSSQTDKGYFIVNVPNLDRLKWKNYLLFPGLTEDAIKKKDRIYSSGDILIFM